MSPFVFFASIHSFHAVKLSMGLGSVPTTALLKQSKVDTGGNMTNLLKNEYSEQDTKPDSSMSSFTESYNRLSTSNKVTVKPSTPMGPRPPPPLPPRFSPLLYNNQNDKKTFATSQGNNSTMLLKKWHSIYQKGWDRDPIVLPKYKLLFFTMPKVGCTVFKQLFRRMMGYDNWHVQIDPWLPHQPKKNGLKYLNHYSIEEANHMMTSTEWTRAIFLRDTKERVLSAYLDKVTIDTTLNGGYIQRNCCNPKNGGSAWSRPKICDIVRRKKQLANERISVNGTDCSFQCFLEDIVPHCDDPHWRPSMRRIEKVFWPQMTFIGHFETLIGDTRRLLQQLRSLNSNETAWDLFGQSGWGKHGNQSIFESNIVSHSTSAKQKLQKHYTLELEKIVRERYREDYESEILNMTWKSCFD